VLLDVIGAVIEAAIPSGAGIACAIDVLAGLTHARGGAVFIWENGAIRGAATTLPEAETRARRFRAAAFCGPVDVYPGQDPDGSLWIPIRARAGVFAAICLADAQRLNWDAIDRCSRSVARLLEVADRGALRVEPPAAVTPAQAAKILGISEDVVQSMLDQRVWRSREAGSERCAYLEDVLAYRKHTSQIERRASRLRVSPEPHDPRISKAS